jgi:two-component system NtrC family sensor kinase
MVQLPPFATVSFNGNRSDGPVECDCADPVALGRAERLASVGQLAAGLAHEMNTPLGSISAHAEESLEIIDHLQDGCLTSQATADLRSRQLAIMRQANRCSRIASRLLLFAQSARPVGGKSRPEEVINDVIQLFVAAAQAKGVRLDRRVGGQLPDVLIGPSELEQLLVNLIQNSLDACEQGETISIEGSAHDGQLHVAIADTGCGISQKSLSRIFDPFFTTKPVGQGTGLGLSVCLGIIRSVRGTIEVESAPGHGTRVRVTLPVDRSVSVDARTRGTCQTDVSPSCSAAASHAGGQR